MNSGQLMLCGVVFVASCLSLASLWKTPSRRWRSLRPPGGFSHRLRIGLMVGFVDCYIGIIRFLFDAGAPAWLVNAPEVLLHTFVPDDVRVAAFTAALRRDEAKKGGAK